MSANKKLKVVMVGGWGHGNFVINDFAKNKPDNAQLVAMGQTTADEPFMKTPETLGAVTKYKDYKKMLQEVKPEVAVISTRLDLLNQAAVTAAEAGCHLICEKPLAVSRPQLENLYRILKEKNKSCILLLNNRANPYLRAVRSLVIAGKIGEVVLVNAQKSYPWSEDRVEKFPIKLGGTIGWVGIHALDFINAATDLFFTKVTGMESNQIDPDFDRCPDNCGLVFELCNGGHANVSLDYHRPQASPHHGDDWLRIVGKKGTIKANLTKGKINCCTDREAEYAVTIPEQISLLEQYYDYLLGNGYQNKFSLIKEAAFRMTEACIVAQQAVIENKILDIV